MQVGDLCSSDIVSISAGTPVQEAARLMRNSHVGVLVVTDPHDPSHAIGMVSDRDLVTRLLAREGAHDTATVDDLCSHALVAVRRTASPEEAAHAMRAAGVRRLLVQDAGGGICGVLSVDDLVDALACQAETLAQVLRSGRAREASRLHEALAGGSLPGTGSLTDDMP